jgi:hypothetical protein
MVCVALETDVLTSSYYTIWAILAPTYLIEELFVEAGLALAVP